MHMKWGVIGTGNMGNILIDAWITSNTIEKDQLYITNRTIDKAYKIQDKYPGVHVIENIETLIKKSDILYICVKPLEIYPLIKLINPLLKENQCIVSITSPYSVSRLESLVSCQVARMIPSITNRALAGVTLVTFGERISKEMEGYLLQSVRIFSSPVAIEDGITRVSSDIVSCGPAFFGFLAQRFIKAAAEETNISETDATLLTSEMLKGYGKLLEDGHYTLPELIEKVCVKGGVTGEGIKVFEQELGQLFNHLFQKTHEKYEEDKEKINSQIYNR